MGISFHGTKFPWSNVKQIMQQIFTLLSVTVIRTTKQHQSVFELIIIFPVILLYELLFFVVVVAGKNGKIEAIVSEKDKHEYNGTYYFN